MEEAQKVMERYKDRFGPALVAKMRAKLGLDIEREGDDKLANGLFEIMHANRADFTLTFRNLSKLSKSDASRDAPVRDLFLDRAAFDAWAAQYRERLAHEPRDDAERAAAMNRVNPKYVLRNHLAENAIRRAAEKFFGSGASSGRAAPSIRRTARIRSLRGPAARLGERSRSQLFFVGSPSYTRPSRPDQRNDR